GAEAFNAFVPYDSRRTDEAIRRRDLSRLGWDLQFGVMPPESCTEAEGAIDSSVRARLDALATTDNTIAGHDFYPVSVVPLGRPVGTQEARCSTLRGYLDDRRTRSGGWRRRSIRGLEHEGERMALRWSYWPADTSEPVLDLPVGGLLRRAAADAADRPALVA